MRVNIRADSLFKPVKSQLCSQDLSGMWSEPYSLRPSLDELFDILLQSPLILSDPTSGRSRDSSHGGASNSSDTKALYLNSSCLVVYHCSTKRNHPFYSQRYGALLVPPTVAHKGHAAN